jgi:hypothetical protein
MGRVEHIFIIMKDFKDIELNTESWCHGIIIFFPGLEEKLEGSFLDYLRCIIPNSPF